MARRLIRTFLDSGVLIAAFKGGPALAAPAAAMLNDPNRIFLSSPFVRLEVSPKALFSKQEREYRFYQRYFRRSVMPDDLEAILRAASRECGRAGVGAMDGLHLAAARLLKADEFITTEKTTKSIHRSKLVKVVYLYQ